MHIDYILLVHVTKLLVHLGISSVTFMYGSEGWEYNVFWGSTVVLLQCDGVF